MSTKLRVTEGHACFLMLILLYDCFVLKYIKQDSQDRHSPLELVVGQHNRFGSIKAISDTIFDLIVTSYHGKRLTLGRARSCKNEIPL